MNNLEIVKDPVKNKDFKDRYKVGMVSLGCDKNRIDSEIMLGNMSTLYTITNNPKEADIILVNTCGFIEAAKQESIDTILEMAEYKKKYKCKMLIATGCLTQRYGDELQKLIPEIDIMLGVNDYEKLNELITAFINEDKKALSVTRYSDDFLNEGKRILTTESSTAYVRIAEGCNNFCTYCIIPKIRGKFRSRKIESIIKEVESLAEQGVKEIILVAQDTTMYGTDLYNAQHLHILLKELKKIEGIKWIRLLYCYPEELYDELIEEIAQNEKVVKYIDIPIQHISDNVLKRMARKTTKAHIIANINKLRNKVKDIIIRTTFIVGFPGETEEDFKEIIEFLEDFKLDKVGVFTYSREEDTPAAKMENQIEEEVKHEREEKLMLIQKSISEGLNKLKIGKTYDILVEGYKKGYYYGRSFEMAPDIDGNVFFKSEDKISNGEFIKIEVTKSMDYDLIGVVANESRK